MDIVQAINDILKFSLLQRAFGAGLIVAAVLPLIGMIVSLKRLSMIGDALSHTSLAGVAVGLLLGFNPIAGAVAICIAAALGIELIRKFLSRFSEMSIAIIMSAGIGLAGLLVNLLSAPANFNRFLFGSISAVSVQDFRIIAVLSAAVFAAFVLMYRQLFYTALDEQSARLSGFNVKIINFTFTVMTAVTVSIASRIVGALVVSSIMILPVACAMQLEKGFKITLAVSVCFALAFTLAGLFLSYMFDLAPSGSIVMPAVITFVAIAALKAMFSRKKRRKTSVINEKAQAAKQ